MKHVYDMIVIGGGPGGYTAALYAARGGLDTLVLERLAAGGQMALTHQIDNYPGFEEGVDGFSLGEKMRAQAQRFGVKTVFSEVRRVDWQAQVKEVETPDGVFYGRTVVLATGANPRELGIDQEKDLAGMGVHYCAACDGMFYRGKTVVVVGGGNSAVADALLLSRVAKEVILVHRRDTLRAAKIYHEQLNKCENLTIRWNSAVESFLRDERLTGVTLKNLQSGETEQISCDGVFVSIGRVPASALAEGGPAVDEQGYILAGEDTKTSLAGVYAVGDVRTKTVRQIVTAVADGAVAAHYAQEYLG